MFQLGLDTLTIKKCTDIIHHNLSFNLTKEVEEKIIQSRQTVERILKKNKPVYGINTGFGSHCDVVIDAKQVSQLQMNLLLSHAVGVGSALDTEITQLMMICKLHALSLGHSGIRLSVIERIIDFYKKDLIPIVPSQGSVGASGDLCPLSHLFLPLMGKGLFRIKGWEMPAEKCLNAYQLESMELQAKEGLALINGTQFILAHAVKGLDKMGYLLDLADLAGAMSLESFQGSKTPFRNEIHQLRPFKGLIKVAQRLNRLLLDSQNMMSHEFCHRVQDPYSIRCITQVHGASRNAWEHLKELTEIELNSVTDNPIVINENEVLSGGNFHGQPLAMALDYCSIAASELGNISERRSYLLLKGEYKLPKLLVENAGLNSGFMIPQYVAAALVTENKTLCFPPSCDSITTSLGQEDHVSMGSISGTKFLKILTNLEKIIAVELMLAAQGMEFRRPNTFSDILEHNHQLIRNNVPKLEKDRLLKNDVDKIVRLVEQRKFKVNV